MPKAFVSRQESEMLFFRVPNTYLECPFFAFLAFCAPCRINKLRILNREREFESPSRHQKNSN
jgi:hypothetical protein